MDISSSLLLLSFVLFVIIIFIFNKINGLRTSSVSKKKLTDHVSTHSYGSRFPQGSLGWPILGETIEFVSSAYSDYPESFMDKRQLMYELFSLSSPFNVHSIFTKFKPLECMTFCHFNDVIFLKSIISIL